MDSTFTLKESEKGTTVFRLNFYDFNRRYPWVARNELPWQPAQAQFELLADEIVARQGQFQVSLSLNANSAPAVVVLLPDGQQQLRGSLLALRYFDAASGQSVTLGTIQDCQGELLDATTVVFTNALAGIGADLVYELGLGKIEADLVLRQRPPEPESLKLNPATTRLQIWTEWFEPPTPVKTQQVWRQETDPQKRQQMAEPDWVNEFLDFASMQMPAGRAFLSGSANSSSTPVSQRWIQAEGRTFLVEQIPYSELKPLLATLPRQASATVPSDRSADGHVSKSALPGGAQPAIGSHEKLADRKVRAPLAERGRSRPRVGSLGGAQPAIGSIQKVAHWNGADFEVKLIDFSDSALSSENMEHVSFAPISLPVLP